MFLSMHYRFCHNLETTATLVVLSCILHFSLYHLFSIINSLSCQQQNKIKKKEREFPNLEIKINIFFYFFNFFADFFFFKEKLFLFNTNPIILTSIKNCKYNFISIGEKKIQKKKKTHNLTFFFFFLFQHQ